MSNQNPSNTVVELLIPTAFPDLNAKEGKEEGYARTTVQVARLKFSHLRKMQSMDEDGQMMFAMATLTGLSESDLDELDAVDSAKIMTIVYGFMESFFKLAHKITNTAVTGS